MNVLVTGGTGSFGNAFVRRWLTSQWLLSDSSPNGRVIVYSRDEEKQWRMKRALQDEDIWKRDGVNFFIGDVRDRKRLSRAMEADVWAVIHAAALKQVDACEYNPLEAIKTNVDGTANVIDAALDHSVGKVLLISSDKAVAPINLYGMTKGCAEKMMVHANAYAGTRGTRFAAVRYGNVAGSRGSFLEALPSMEVVKITDQRMTRFWWALSEAVGFVIKALLWMRGGEVFVPKLKAMPIMEMVRALCPRASIQMVGIRAGEKIHESLITEDEARRTVELEECFVINPDNPQWAYMSPPRGMSLADGFSYRSDTAQQLNADELLQMAGQYGRLAEAV